MKSKLFFPLLSLLVIACSYGASDLPSERWSSAGEDRGPGEVGPRPEGRIPRRLSITQIDRTLRSTFGDTWTTDDPRVEIFPILGPMLGQPDYITDSVESLDPSPLFAKFMDNMAAKKCVTAVLADLGSPPPASPVIVKFRSDVDQNLRYLRLLLHAVYVPPGSTREIADLRELYDTLRANTENPDLAEVIGWTGVCTAMLTDPEFMTY